MPTRFSHRPACGVARRAAASTVAALLLPALASAAPQARGPETVQAVWEPVEIRYSYFGLTTAYNCDAFADKMKRVLRALGAPPQTRVRAAGCPQINVPSRSFFVTITTARPVPAGEAGDLGRSEQALIERLGGRNALPADPFPATWKTVALSEERRLHIEPGDCELIEGLRDHVLPKLSVEVISENVRCRPKQLDLFKPELEVSVLMPAGRADVASAEAEPPQQQ